ncbi:MAG: TetR/AcrR family transcriptional regulator [Phycisphaerales bacterium]|nr:TetR/AcrR family transcriptional regulator [Phycisphaerales bacterium]
MSRLPAALRREQLLDVAAELFSVKGYAGATTAQIAKVAGITEPIIYRHFKSKRDLFVALIERTGRQTLEQWEVELEGVDDPSARLAKIINENPMVSEKGRKGYRVLLQSISEVDDQLIHKAVSDHMTRLHAFITREIERAQEAHKVTTRFSAGVLAWVLVNVGMGYGVLTAMGVPGHGFDASGVHVKDVLGRILVGRDRQAENVNEPVAQENTEKNEMFDSGDQDNGNESQ